MTNTVYFDPVVGGDGSTVTDDSNATTGLGNGGHRLRFIPALAQLVAVAAYVVAQASGAAASAASALGAPGTNATSVTSFAIGTGSKTFAIQTGKLFQPGQFMVAASAADPANQMAGLVTAANSGTGSLTLNIISFGGSGTHADWILSLSVAAGVQSTAGLTGVISADDLTTALALQAADITDFNAAADSRAAALAIVLGRRR